MTTDPIKLTSAKNLKHQNHLCTNFAKATINALEELAGLLGPHEVTFHSEDDKAKVLIRIIAASKQAVTNAHGVQCHLNRPQLHSCIVAQVNSISNW